MEKVRFRYNGFAKIINTLFHDDFAFRKAGDGAISGFLFERINDDTWREISSCRFKNIVYERDGAFEKHLRGNIENSLNCKDFEKLDNAISLYKSIFINKTSYKERNCIEKECWEIFYQRDIQDKIRKYECVHKQYKYACEICHEKSQGFAQKTKKKI